VFNAWYTSGKSFRSLDSVDGRPNPLFQRWLDHPAYDTFWRNMVPYAAEFANIDIPILTTTGYYDDDQRGAFYYYLKHLSYNPKAKHYLLIGPWNHGGAQSAAYPEIRGYHIDSTANIVINETVFKWFDHILKDSAMPPRLKDKVNYEVMGANEWRSAPSVEAISKKKMTLYLSNVVSKNAYQLAVTPPAKASTITQEVDFKDRSAFNESQFDYNIIDTTINVADGLVFKTAPLQNDLTIAGSFDGLLEFETNKKDFDYTIELYEQRANGKYQLLSTHLARASYGKDHDQRKLLVPGTQHTIPIYNAFFTAAKLSKGSRIVLVLGINNSPQWQINYGTGKDVSLESIKDATIPLQINWSNKSYIRLPVAE
jgi:putative CocE/NonD family hydrolase